MSVTSLEGALSLARRGIRVFPLKKNSKLPAIENFSAKATCDPSAIVAMFSSGQYNIGIACGKITDGKYLLGFDIDKKGDRDGFETLSLLEEIEGELPKTWRQKTPSGGEHRLFFSKVPIRQGTNVCGTGIDFRGDGGYLVAPGSIINGRAYVCLEDIEIAWIPDPFADKYQKREVNIRTVGNRRVNQGKPAEDQDYARERAIAFLEAQDTTYEGSRGQDCFKFAARLRDLGLTHANVIELLSKYWKCEPLLSLDELAITSGNAFNYAKNPMGVDAIENIFPPLTAEESIAPPATPAPEEHALHAMNKDHFYIAANGVSRVCWETIQERKAHLERFPPHIFHEKYSSRKIMWEGKLKPLSQVWMGWEGRRTYNCMRFSPANDLDANAYNTWKGFAIKPLPSGVDAAPEAQHSVDLFLEHLLVNICQGDPELNKWLLNFFAHLFQRPGEKPEVSLVFKGRKGTGKTIVSVILNHLIGDNSVILADKTHALGHFNSIMEDKLLVTLNEAFWSGDKSVEGSLKEIITEGTRVITHKGAEPYTARVYDRIIITGNEDWVVPASGGDERRFAVFTVGEAKQQDRSFFGAMKSGLFKRGGSAALMRFFLEWPLVEDDVNVAPQTEGLDQQKQHSLSVFPQWWFSCLQEGQVLGAGLDQWPQDISTKDFFQAFVIQLEADGNRAYKPSRISMGMTFKSMYPSCTHARTATSRSYHFSSLEQARRDWDTWQKTTTKWD